jgi:hypothetical protein
MEVARSYNFHIRALHPIRRMLTLDVAWSVAVVIIAFRLDYCNSLFHGMPKHNFDRLQRLQNELARVVNDVSNLLDLVIG